MAESVDLARANAAILYKPPEKEGSTVDAGSRVHKDDHVDAVELIKDILQAQEALGQLKAKSRQLKLEDEWSNPLGADLVDALSRLVNNCRCYLKAHDLFQVIHM